LLSRNSPTLLMTDRPMSKITSRLVGSLTRYLSWRYLIDRIWWVHETTRQYRQNHCQRFISIHTRQVVAVIRWDNAANRVTLRSTSTQQQQQQQHSVHLSSPSFDASRTLITFAASMHYRADKIESN